MRLDPLRAHAGLTVALLLALVAGRASEHRALAASPRAILFYGGPLPAPVAIQSRTATAAFLGALEPDAAPAAPDSARRVAGAGAVHVAVFWSASPSWSERDTLPAAAFHPAQSDQQGRLLPATRGAPAVLVLDAGSGFAPARLRVTARAARMLAERGVPVAMLLP